MHLLKVIKSTFCCRNQSVVRYAGTYSLPPYKLHLLEDALPTECTITKDEAIRMYRNMVAIRRMEIQIADFYRLKLVRGFCHLYNGQEATACGLFDVARNTDTFITSYRAHGFTLLLNGGKFEPVIAELIARETGCSKGKGGSMHVYAPRFYGGNGIVGAQVPLGTGIGLFHKYTDNKGISFTMFGDGAANQGQVFESYNMAALWKLPVVFIVENNLYAMGTSTNRGSANPDYYRNCPYIPGILVDGMDILSVREAARYAIAHVMDGKGPMVLEMRAYRYFGHSMSDPGSSYRTRDEIKEMRETRDPIKKFAERLVGDDLITHDELENINKEITKETKDISAKIQKAKMPEMEHLTGDIYKNNVEPMIRGITTFKPLVHKNFPPPKI